MAATLTIPTLGPTSGPSGGQSMAPNRHAPQSDGPSEDQRFAALLQQRREAQPPPAPETRRDSNTEAKPATRPAAREPGDSAQRSDAARDAEATSAHETTLAASTGCAAAKPAPAGKPATRPSGDRRELPIVEVPMLPPNATIDAAATSNSSTADDAAATAGDTIPAPPGADPSVWPGMPAATADAATPVAGSALAAGSGAAPQLRIGTGTQGAATAGMLPADGTTVAAGQSGGGRQGGGDAGPATDAAAARLDAATARLDAATARLDAEAAPIDAEASNAAIIAAANTADRFALPRARTPDSALPGLAGAVVPHRLDASPAPTVALATPLTAPDFAKALGAQVSLFARNGMGHAELQLTPAEMGPIQVRIALDGAHARIDFAADSAATRQVIERGLPELASALREQGLTLSGGGVFQRAPDQRHDGDEAPAARVGRAPARHAAEPIEPIDGAARSARARAIAAERGGVDLYA